jgi:Na+-translocating ferredoxin:NAD+ oxidoreductase RnfC subunit
MTSALEDWGVVGAGGAGFPTEVKLRAKAELVIVNAAECEPLLHKDKELILHESRAMLAGLRTAMERVGARRAVVGIRSMRGGIRGSHRSSRTSRFTRCATRTRRATSSSSSTTSPAA